MSESEASRVPGAASGAPTAAAGGTATSDPVDLAARYGRSTSATRNRVVAASGAGLVVLFVAWLVWGGLLAPPAQLEALDTGHQIISDSEVMVRWQLSVTPGSAAKCAVQALNSTFAIVGWAVVDLPPAAARTRAFTHSVRTTELAVTGLIYRCWLA